MKKPKRIRYKRRIVIYSIVVFLLLFSIIDYYCETFGLPEFARRFVREEMQVRGFDIEFDDLKCGVVNGIVLTNVALRDSQLDLDDFLVAEKLEIFLRPSFGKAYFTTLGSLKVVSGSLKIPLFPEFEEGRADILTLQNVNSEVALTGDGLEILYFSGTMAPFDFSAYGSFSNVFFSDIFVFFLYYEKKKKIMSFSIFPTIKSIAFETRASFYREFLDIKDNRVFTSGAPKCQLMFDVDALKPKLSTINGNIQLPKFDYGDFSIQEVKANLAYSDNALALTSMYVKFPDDGELTLRGGWNRDGLINAVLEGRLTSEEISDILSVFDIQIPPPLQITKSLPIKITLKDFSLDTNSSRGDFYIVVPEAKFRDMHIYNLKTKLRLSNDIISATHLSFETDRNKVKGSFDYDASSMVVDASLQSSGPPIFLVGLIGDENAKMMNSILSRFTFPKDDKNVEMSADIHCSWDKKLFFFIRGNMAMHSFKYLGIPFDSSDAKIVIDSNNILIIPMITLIQKDSIATLAMLYDDSENLKYSVESPFFDSDDSGNGLLMLNGDSSLPGDYVLKCIFPDWENDVIDLSAPVNAKAEGVIDFSGKNNPNLTDFKVKITDSEAKWYSIPVNDFNCDLIFNELNMDIANATGKVYNGTLDLYYHTNFDTEKGKVKVDLKNADFVPVVKHIKWDLNGDGGKMSVTTGADLEYDKDDNLLMRGKGTLKIRDANLWEVPLINSFGQLAKQWLGKKWGIVSELDADFQYKKDHIFSNNMHTNGNVIALRSEGKYYWSTGDFNFLIHAEVMKSILPFKIVTKIFDPISGLMESRVIRKNGEIKWKKVSWREKFFSNE